MATWRRLYETFLTEIKKAESDTLRDDFVDFVVLCNMDIQNFAGVAKTWSVDIDADTQSYTFSGESITDLYRAREGRFLADGGTDELDQYTLYPLLDRFDDKRGRTGFYIVGTTIYLPVMPTENGTLKIRGDKTLNNITSTDLGSGATTTPEIDADVQDVYVWFAARGFGGQKQDFAGDGRVPYFNARYLARRNALESRYNERWHYAESQVPLLEW